jgi:hypothetical protein
VAGAHSAQALDAYWCGPRSDLWHHGIDPANADLSNWYSAPPGDTAAFARDVPDGTAIFPKDPVRTDIRFTEDAEIEGIHFPQDAPQYTFRILGRRWLDIGSLGVVTETPATPRFLVLGAESAMNVNGPLGLIGPAVRSASIHTSDEGALNFYSEAGGGRANVVNEDLGTTNFRQASSAERMTITNRRSGAVYFYGRSSGDRAHITNEAHGILRAQKALGPDGNKRLPIGKVDNGGEVSLNTTKLVVSRTYFQSNNGSLSLGVSSPTTFGAVIATKGARLGGDLSVHIGATAVAGFVRIVQVLNGPLVGRFANVTFSGPGETRLRGSLVYTAREVRLVLQPK